MPSQFILRCLFSVLVAGLFGCTDSGYKPPSLGTEGGHCLEGRLCDDGLTCISDYCVPTPIEDSTSNEDATPEEDVTNDVAGGDTTEDATDGDTMDVTEDATAPPEDVVDPDVVEEDPIPPVDVQPAFSNCSEPGGDRNIYDLRDPQCPDHISPAPTSSPGVELTLKGVVVTGVFSDTFFIQEENGGPYSGIAVYSHGLFTGDLLVGDRVDVTGGYTEYFDSSQIHLSEWTVLSSGTAPEPWLAPHPSHVSTEGSVAELFEGVLVRVLDVKTIHTEPDCPQHFGEFLVTGDLRVDDMGVSFEARLGDHFLSITGPLHYAFGNFKLEPRTEVDLDLIVAGGDSAVSKCLASECVVPEDFPGTGEIRITEVMADPQGSDAGQEWIELHNPGSGEVDLTGWELRDCHQQAWPLMGSNIVLPAGGFMVLGTNSNSTTNGGVPVDIQYGEAFYLPNTVGSALLFNGSGPAADLVDQMRYTAFEPDYTLIQGASMERVTATAPGPEPGSWTHGTAAFGFGENLGTPGEKNSTW